MRVEKSKTKFRIFHDPYTFETVLAIYKTPDTQGNKEVLTKKGWKTFKQG
jgi:hypothetical protein